MQRGCFWALMCFGGMNGEWNVESGFDDCEAECWEDRGLAFKTEGIIRGAMRVIHFLEILTMQSVSCVLMDP